MYAIGMVNATIIRVRMQSKFLMITQHRHWNPPDSKQFAEWKCLHSFKKWATIESEAPRPVATLVLKATSYPRGSPFPKSWAFSADIPVTLFKVSSDLKASPLTGVTVAVTIYTLIWWNTRCPLWAVFLKSATSTFIWHYHGMMSHI